MYQMCAADVDWNWTAEVINLDGRPVIRVQRGPYLINYYNRPDDIPLEIRRQLKLKGQS